jgi:DNA processing protein
MTAHSLFFLSLARVTFLRPKERMLLAEIVSGVEDFLRLGKNDLEALIGRRIRALHFNPADYVKMAQTDELYLTKRNILCTFYADGNYPVLLREIYDPPLVLFYRGVLPPSAQKAVAVVGTRQPGGKALQAAFELGIQLAREGICVVSGLALGIDRAAHRGTVEANGCAVAVLGNGIDTIYPHSSRQLAEKILAKGGALVSEYPPLMPPLKHHFPARNRIISGLSEAVVVIEAGAKSGALITADYALEQGRELFVHEAGCSRERGSGTLSLAQDGAKTISRAEQIFNSGQPAQTVQSAPFFKGDADQALGLAQLLELELQNKVFLRNGEVYWRDENGR